MSSSSSSVAVKRRRKRPKLWHIAVSIPLVCGLGGWIWTAILERQAMAEVQREVAKLRALGIPTTPEEMNRGIAPESNAAPLYQRAMVTYKAGGSAKSINLRSPGTRPEDKAAYVAFVEGQDATMEYLARAARLPDCEWYRNWALGPNLPLPEYAEMKNFVKMVVAKSYLEAGKGNFSSSMDHLLIGKRIAFHCREPVLISVLASISIESIVQTEFQRQLSEHGDSPAFRKEAKRFISATSELPSIREGLKGEVLLIRTTVGMLARNDSRFQEIIGNGGGDFRYRTMIYAYRFPFVRAAIEARALKEYRITFDNMGDGKDNQKQWAAADALDMRSRVDQSFMGQMLNAFFPMFAAPGQSVRKLEAIRMMSSLGLQIWEAKAKTGAFPVKFDTGKDPYTGAPFVYKKTATGFRLYCVGHNGKDDGGSRKPGSMRIDDIEFGNPGF